MLCNSNLVIASAIDYYLFNLFVWSLVGSLRIPKRKEKSERKRRGNLHTSFGAGVYRSQQHYPITPPSGFPFLSSFQFTQTIFLIIYFAPSVRGTLVFDFKVPLISLPETSLKGAFFRYLFSFFSSQWHNYCNHYLTSTYSHTIIFSYHYTNSNSPLIFFSLFSIHQVIFGSWVLLLLLYLTVFSLFGLF
ncbi:hypothetical protein RJT34_33338 [Clitoria ternatea]|uniref:Uncharacterized protein n=1 Tax=Clitoria ternatea TaxID=43366 RepID=A0AAN9EZR4_CLITE